MADNPEDPRPDNNGDNNVFDLNTRKGRNAARRALNQASARDRAVQTAENRQAREARENRCQAIAQSSNRRCRAKAVKTAIDPDDGVPKRLCVYHSSDAEERKALLAQAHAIRAQRQAKPHELMRAVVESNPIAFMQPYLDALGVRVVFVPDPADPAILHPTAVADPASQGATLFGVSKDGHVIVSKHKDMEAQQRAAERLFDRVYGKPKQTNIIASTDNDSNLNIMPFDQARQQEIAAILQAAKKPSHQMTPEQLN